MTAQVLVNDLLNIPHRYGQTVLHARRDDFEVQVDYRPWHLPRLRLRAQERPSLLHAAGSAATDRQAGARAGAASVERRRRYSIRQAGPLPDAMMVFQAFACRVQ